MLLAAAFAVLAWPGIALYDTVDQYRQALEGVYQDWHPPVMAALWSALVHAGLHGTAPMLLLQLIPFHIGIALTVAAIGGTARSQFSRLLACWLILAVPLSWMVIVLKDTQGAAVLTLAAGIVAWFRLRHGKLPPWAVGVIALLLAYGVLVRANAVFAVVPLAFALGGWGGLRSTIARAVLVVVATGAAIVGSSLVNHHVFDASPSHVERTLPLYDLAGIAHFAPLPTMPGLPLADWRRAEATHCYTSFYWDSLGDAAKCGYISDELAFGDGKGETIIRDWLGAVVAHPLAYAEHRLRHWNSNLRFIVPAGEPSGPAPADSQPNEYGIGLTRGLAVQALAPIGQFAAASPLGWPVVWLAAAAGLWWSAAGTPRSPRRDLALALGLSSTLMLLSFAAVSIASDLRYHLWSMIAATLGWMLLGTGGVPAMRVRGTLVGVVAVIAIGTMSRMSLPPIIW